MELITLLDYELHADVIQSMKTATQRSTYSYLTQTMHLYFTQTTHPYFTKPTGINSKELCKKTKGNPGRLKNHETAALLREKLQQH